MGIELFFSNRSETLIEKLDVVLTANNRSHGNIFKSPMVIVPNANLSKWIKLQLAHKNAIMMNINFQYLESGFWSLIEILDIRKNKPKLLDLNLRQMLIFHVLKNITDDQIEFKPVTDYLQNQTLLKQPDYSKRLWQLSEKLAFLFQEYEFNRSEMICKWRKGFPATHHASEVCQQKIYMEVTKIRNQYAMENGIHYLSIMEYSEMVFSELEYGSNTEVVDRCIHLFGFSNISSFHIDLIKKLSAFYQIFIYSINPCREFWEDINTPWENRWTKQINFRKQELSDNEDMRENLFSQSPNSLLSLWGKPGRESVRMLCQMTDYDFNTCYAPEKKNPTVLESIQNHLLTFQNSNESNLRIGQDISLQIAACPSRFREVETVYNSILYNLEKDGHLKLTDIAIQVPEISAYKPFIDAVFDRRSKTLSYNLVDAHAEIESLFGKAILKLLDLASGRFSRREIFELLLNPCTMQKWNLTVDDIRIFAEWSQALNIFHTYDKNSKRKKGYPVSNMFTWKQGLIRLKLSRIFSDPEDLTGRVEPFGLNRDQHFHEMIPYSDTSTGDTELLEKFCLIIETLHNHCEQLNQSPCRGEEWKQKVLTACNNLFIVPRQHDSEKAVQRTLFSSLEELCFLDRISTSEMNSNLDLAQIKEFIKSRLGAIRGGYGDYLTSGVTISSLLPMRPIPFKIVYVLGMQEGDFPGKAETFSLDLRLSQRKPGDISAPEKNCYLFLELILSVRKKLYISYVSKDLQKDRILQPCSVINQLRRYIEAEIFNQNQSFEIIQVPLRGSSEKYFKKKGIDNRSDLLVNYSTADRITFYREQGLWHEIVTRISEQEKELIKPLLPDFSLDPSIAGQPENFPEKITIRQLGKFLKNPVKQNIQRHLLLFDPDETVEEMTIIEDEPFYGQFPTAYRLKMEPLRQWIDYIIMENETTDYDKILEDFFQNTYNRFRLESQTPEGAYGLLDQETTRQELNQWAATLKPILSQMLSFKKFLYHRLRVGEPADQLPVFSGSVHSLQFSKLQLTVSTFDHFKNPICRNVEIHGGLPWLWKDDSGSWHSIILTGSDINPGQKLNHHLIEPVLTWLAAACLKSEKDFFKNVGITFHEVYQNGIRDWTLDVKSEYALDYIQKLTGQFLNPHMRLWIPFDAVTDAVGNLGEICLSDRVETLRENFAMKLSAAFAENEDPMVYLSGVEIDMHALQEACNRFGIFFNHLTLKR